MHLICQIQCNDIEPNASKCETDTNPQYPELCSEDEDFNQTRNEVAEVDITLICDFIMDFRSDECHPIHFK